MQKGLFFLFLTIAFPVSIYTQDIQPDTDPNQLEIISGNDQPVDPKSSLKDRTDFDIEVGTSFSFSPGNYYGPSYYAAPSFSYRLSPRFFLTTGVGLEYSTFYPVNRPAEPDNMLPMTRAFLFARGSYYLTPRFIVNGTVYKNMMDSPRHANYNNRMNYSAQGMSIGFQYKVSDSFSFGVQMNMQNGYYQNDPLIPPSGYVPVPGF
jgi:hypothetical protein